MSVTLNSERRSRLAEADPEVYGLLCEQTRQEASTLKLIASENFASSAVLEALGSIFTNKYAEGYPGARYYEGNEIVDALENLATARLKYLFGAEHANVQPYSGSPANQAVYRALAQPGDKIMGMAVPEGGHLTHGWGVNFSGTDYSRVPYGVNPGSGRIDYDNIREIAKRERPKVIWVGGTAYPRIFDYTLFAEIASEIDAYLVADIAHVSGLILAGVQANPVPFCDVVSSTSHKTLRGPRGGFILSRIEDRYQSLYHRHTKFDLRKRIDRGVFPLLQGGPHMNTIAGIAVALKEASTKDFQLYGRQIISNAQALAGELCAYGHSLVSGGTDNHMLILDFRDCSYSGKEAAAALARAGLIANFNMVPGDQRKPSVTSGLRIGTAAITSMGMKESDMNVIAKWINAVLSRLSDESTLRVIAQEVSAFCQQFPVPGIRDVAPLARSVVH